MTSTIRQSDPVPSSAGLVVGLGVVATRPNRLEESLRRWRSHHAARA